MAVPLLYTKLYQPIPRPGLKPRPRLVRRLEECLQPGVRLALVSAPAGYGKTTLVAGWLAELKEKEDAPQVTWLALDEGDNDPARLLTYVITALRKLCPDLGAGLLSLLGMPQLPPLDTLVGELINEMAAIPQPFLLVLDDFHTLDNPRLFEALELFLQRLPPHARLVLTTRQDPPLPLSRMRVRGEVVELRANDLRFTIDEAGDFFRETLGQALDDAALQTLAERTEGWIAGLQLAALALRESGAGAESVQAFIAAFGGSHRYVIDYLVDEVLARQEEEVRQFFLRTSVLERFNAELCAAVMGDAGATPADYAALLTRLERSNSFIVPLDGERKWYRYHRLFGDVLRAGLDPETEDELHRRAADWWAAHDDPGEAVRHRLASRDYTQAGQLIAQSAPELFRLGGLVTLLGWIEKLPAETLRAIPDLMVYKTLVLMLTGQVHAGAALFAQIEQLTDNGTQPDPLSRGRQKTLVAWFTLLRGGSGALAAARAAVDLLGEADPLFRVLALIPLGTGLRMENQDLPGSTRAFEEGYELGVRHGNLFGAMGAFSNLMFNLMDMGRMRDAKAYCERAFRQFVDSRGRPLPVQGLVYIPYGAILLEENDLDGAEQYARRGLELCQSLFSSLMMGGDGEMVLAQVAFDRGEYEQAFALIEETYQAARQRGLTPFIQRAEIMAVHLHIRRGDLAFAQCWAEEHGLRDPQRLAAAGGGYAHAYARLVMAEGRREEACQILEDLAGMASAAGLQAARMAVLLRLAIFQAEADHPSAGRRAGNPPQVIENLSEAIRLAAPEGFRHIFVREGPAIRPLLEAARAAAPVFVDDLIASLEPAAGPSALGPVLEAKPSPPDQTGLVEPLSEQEMNVLRMLASGLSNQEIAAQLYISAGTAKWHVHNILGKLDASSRTQAVAKARELRLV